MENETTSLREDQPDVVIKRQVQGPRRAIALKRDLTVKMYQASERDFVAYNEELFCFGRGATAAEAVEEFSGLFEVIWNFLGPKTAEKLAPNVRPIRSAYALLVEESEGE